MESISNALFWISNGLLVPVVVLLLVLLVYALILAGGFLGDFFRHRDGSKRFEAASRELEAHCADAAWCEHLLANYEVDAEKELGRSRLLAKLGPMLGLMGTLIPMGPALVGLAAGDLASMAYNMQVAFATTVVGMLIAAIGVVTLQVKQRWFARELNDLEFLSSKLRHEKA